MEFRYGNLTSQLFANLYYNEADQYIKHELKVKYYFRYMDDSIILMKDKEELKISMWTCWIYTVCKCRESYKKDIFCK